MPCVIGTFAENLGLNGVQVFQAEIGREFFNDSNSPRVLICNLLRGPAASAFLRLFRRSGGKPPYTLASSDPESFECRVRRTRAMFLSLNFQQYINGLDPRPGQGQALYKDSSSSAVEELVTSDLEESQLDKTLQNLVQWIPQCTRQSSIESMRLMATRCSELKKEIEYAPSYHMMTS